MGITGKHSLAPRSTSEAGTPQPHQILILPKRHMYKLIYSPGRIIIRVLVHFLEQIVLQLQENQIAVYPEVSQM